MTVIYLSDNRIQIVSGTNGKKASISEYVYNTEIRTCMFNGTVINKEVFCKIVNQLFEEHHFPKKKVMLILSGNQIMTRVIKMPTKNDAGTLAYLANDFANVERAKTPVYGYTVLQTDKKTRLSEVLAYVIDQTFLEGYIALFAECGIEISEVEPALACAVRALGHVPNLKENHVVVQAMEETGFTNLLFINGKYAYSNFVRLFSSHDTPEAGTEVARSIGNLVQFTKAQQIECDIRAIWFAGFSELDQKNATETLSATNPEIVTSILASPSNFKIKGNGLQFGDCIYLAGGLLCTSKSHGFVIETKTEEEKKKSNVSLLVRYGAILGGLLAICIAAIVVLNSMRSSYQKQLDEMRAWIASDETKELQNDANILSSNRENCYQRRVAMKSAAEILAGYPKANSKVNEILQQCAADLVTVKVLQYSSSSGELKIDTTAENVDLIHQFIAILEYEPSFEVLEYSGYQYIESAQVWSVNVILCLDATAGK